MKRIGLIVIGLLALATIAVVLLKRFRSTTQPRTVVVRTTPVVGRPLEYEIVAEYPHDTDAYTQGLIHVDGFLYESTGITGRSSLRKVNLETGEIIQQRAADPADFAEGLTQWHGKLLQLTPRRRGNSPPWHLRKFFEDI